MREDIASLRNEYTKAFLDEFSVLKNPFDQFEKWFDEAKNSIIPEPNAMVLCTVGSSGQPSLRTVLLKDLSGEGFTFYTNYNSHKGKEIAENGSVSLLFPWLELERQVIIQGKAGKISRLASEAYFQSRPKDSQIGAHVSRQSEQISSRSVLENKLNLLKEKYRDRQVPLPDDWGGYLVTPHLIEFWQGRPNRLHDRIIYKRTGDFWNIRRLSP
ncbi:MAG: pyridoxamine 5'-phosphate oxidase [Ekhidna sp.]|nr:pyridoxamine 5'-phosphate oxidase [Ekhidna sp.]